MIFDNSSDGDFNFMKRENLSFKKKELSQNYIISTDLTHLY